MVVSIMRLQTGDHIGPQGRPKPGLSWGTKRRSSPKGARQTILPVHGAWVHSTGPKAIHMSEYGLVHLHTFQLAGKGVRAGSVLQIP